MLFSLLLYMFEIIHNEMLQKERKCHENASLLHAARLNKTDEHILEFPQVYSADSKATRSLKLKLT